MNFQKKQEPTILIRLLIIISITCIVSAFLLYFSIIVSWNVNGYYGRLLFKSAGPIAGISSFAALVCSILVKKYRSRTGWFLLGFALISLLFGLWLPSL
jgi:uncharacterized membrane protein